MATVAGVDFRSPVLLAQEAMTVSALSGGRFDFAGEHYRLEGVVPSVHGPRPRLMIGGGGARMLALAAREADIVGINVPLGGADLHTSLAAGATAAERVEAAVETVRAAAGARLAEIELHVNVLACEINAAKLRRIRERLGVSYFTDPHAAAADLARVMRRLRAGE